jgi:hypothetical protein
MMTLPISDFNAGMNALISFTRSLIAPMPVLMRACSPVQIVAGIDHDHVEMFKAKKRKSPGFFPMLRVADRLPRLEI